MSRGEGSMRSPALGMHPALGNDLAIKVCELLDQPDVLEQSRTTATGGQYICVVWYGRTGCIGKSFGFCHYKSSLSEILYCQVDELK
jgi:hypothetical protein